MAAWSCASCGGENPEGMRFCGHCGAAAGKAVAAESPEANLFTGTEAEVGALRSFVTRQVADRLSETGGQLAEERRLVTSLFADLSGFTPLADRLDPEELLEVIDPLISALSNIVGRYEGYVEKYAGDALLAMFGAPVAHEDDAIRALLTAVDMHGEIAALRGQLPFDAQDLTLHVGVNTGHAVARVMGSEVRMDYSVLGDSVILAQRLESAAPPGETYVGETTYRLANRRFEFEAVGELTLKGKREPVRAWRLVGERGAGPGLGRPAGKVGAAFFGREAELALAGRTVDELSSGRGCIISIWGEPGVGKTRLTEQVRAQAHDQGARWLAARCLSYGAALTYWPYAEILRQHFGVRAGDPSEEASSRVVKPLEALGAGNAVPYFRRLLGLPWSGDGPDPGNMEPEAFRRALHDSFRSFFAALSDEAPTVLVIEDVHWSDASSMELTRELATLCLEAPFALYLTGRPEAAPVMEDVGAELPEQRRPRIKLESLDPGQVEGMIQALLGGPATPSLIRTVFERASGNPFFVEEIIRALQDTRVLELVGGEWRPSPGWHEAQLPPTIEEVLSARLDMLTRPAIALLQAGAVIGRRVRLPLLRLVADGADLDRHVQQLVASGLLDRATTAGDEAEEVVAFHHALVQDVAYERMLRRQRRELHLRVAAAAEELYGAGEDSIDLLARHLYLGAAGVKAVDYLVRAGERSKRLFANEEAILHFSRAAEVARKQPDATERLPRILLTLGDLHDLTGDYEEAYRNYAEVREATNDIRAWQGMAGTLRQRGKYGEASDLLAEALLPGRVSGDLRLLWLERAYTLAVTGRNEEAIEAARVGLDLSRSGDGVAAQLYLQLNVAESHSGRLEEALEHGRRAEEILHSMQDLPGLARVLRAIGRTQQQMGLPEEAASTLRRGLELSERVGGIEEIGGCLINLGLVEMERGALDEAVECDRRAIELFERIRHGSGMAIGYGNLAEKLMLRGEDEAALDFCAKALNLAQSIGHSGTMADALKTMAKVQFRKEQFLDAAATAEKAAQTYADLASPQEEEECLSMAGRALRAAGQRERAERVLARASALTQQTST